VLGDDDVPAVSADEPAPDVASGVDLGASADDGSESSADPDGDVQEPGGR